MVTKLNITVAVHKLFRRIPVPTGNCYRMTGELSRSNELLYAFLERSRRLKPLQENILQGGQHCCRSGPDKLLQGRRNTWYNFLAQVEILHSSERM